MLFAEPEEPSNNKNQQIEEEKIGTVFHSLFASIPMCANREACHLELLGNVHLRTHQWKNKQPCSKLEMEVTWHEGILGNVGVLGEDREKEKSHHTCHETNHTGKSQIELMLFVKGEILCEGETLGGELSLLFSILSNQEIQSFFSFFYFLIWVPNNWSNLPDLRGRPSVRDGGNANLGQEGRAATACGAQLVGWLGLKNSLGYKKYIHSIS
ncbi:hypothetical protein CR513_43028, partial [Mucuna pruriens]